MKISETLQKSSPIIPKREMSKTEYMKLVDANTELVDKMNDLQERIDKAIEYIEKEKLKDEEDNFIDLYLDKYESDLLNILKGENYE